MMRIVAPFGFYGAGNIGDEATLNGFAKLLTLSGLTAHVSVGSRNPVHTAQVEPAFRYFASASRDVRRWLAKMRADAQAVIGGTPIMDIQGDWPLSELAPLVRSVDRWKVPMAFVGVGTESLRLKESRRTVAEEIAPRVRRWTVRCERDYCRLVDYGVPANLVTVAADMAWLIEASTETFGRERFREWFGNEKRPVIGVNLINENALFDKHPGFVEHMARALDKLSTDMNARIIFLSNEIREGLYDKAAAIQVIDRMARKESVVLAPNRYFTPWQMMSIIACCDLTISMRYHFCMFSALQQVPFIAIERSDKVTDLCWDMHWSASVVPSKLESVDLVNHASRLRENLPAVREHLRQAGEKMRERARLNVRALEALAA